MSTLSLKDFRIAGMRLFCLTLIIVQSASAVRAQSGAGQTVEVSGGAYVSTHEHWPNISHVYSRLRALDIIHWEDIANVSPEYMVQPSARTTLFDLDVHGAVSLHGMLQGSLELGGLRQIIPLHDIDPGPIVHSVNVRTSIIMNAPSADWGKKVYDVAEAIDALNATAADVVIISPGQDLTVEPSTRAYDTRVAGVISTEPKMLLGSRNDATKQPLALAGVVLCKVSAENGPVAPGDLLVTSSLPGHAMRAQPQTVKPGMLVGRALQPLTQGTGIIEILVN